MTDSEKIADLSRQLAEALEVLAIEKQAHNLDVLRRDAAESKLAEAGENAAFWRETSDKMTSEVVRVEGENLDLSRRNLALQGALADARLELDTRTKGLDAQLHLRELAEKQLADARAELEREQAVSYCAIQHLHVNGFSFNEEIVRKEVGAAPSRIAAAEARAERLAEAMKAAALSLRRNHPEEISVIADRLDALARKES